MDITIVATTTTTVQKYKIIMFFVVD